MEDEVLVRRKAQVEQEDALLSDKEAERLARAERVEETRRERKAKRIEELEKNSFSFQISKAASRYLDGYFLDPILGFFVPGLGDAINGILALPMVYLALVKLKSIPLALAIINNLLVDFMLGLIPWVGDFIDIFYRGNRRNHRLVTGFIEEDRAIIKEVNRKAVWTAISIAIVMYVCYKLVMWVAELTAGIMDWFSTL